MPRGCCVTGWLAATSCRSAAKPFPTLPASPFPKRHDCNFMIASTRGSATLLPKNPTPELSRPSRLGSRAAVAPLKKADRKEQCDMKKQTLKRESLVGWQRILARWPQMSAYGLRLPVRRPRRRGKLISRSWGNTTRRHPKIVPPDSGKRPMQEMPKKSGVHLRRDNLTLS